jgi:fumarate hydratase subunit alpha
MPYSRLMMNTVAIIRASDVSAAVCALYRRINTELRPDVVGLLQAALEREESEQARDVLGVLLENERVARSEGVPLCQDTGLAVAFVRMGAHVVIDGASLQEAVDEGVRRAAAEGPLRASIVSDPLERANTGDNTPAVVHVECAGGGPDALEIALMAKGGGAENMSRVAMLAPGQGREGVVEAVVEAVRRAGANPCPPIIIGVGLGGDFERCAVLAKHALLRDLREPNPRPALAALEAELLERVNALGIGPQGFGGRTTALAVLVEQAPCHIASLPVGINIECHSHRHGTVTLRGERVALMRD